MTPQYWLYENEVITLTDTYSTINEDTQFEFIPSQNDEDHGRFDRCSFKLKARDGGSEPFITIENHILIAESKKDEGDKWYINFRGHFG